jgi:predicted RNA methylase
MRTPIRNPPDPMYAEFEVHRTMIRDRVRTEAFRRAINSVVRAGDIVLDVGAGSGILSVFAARAGAARVYALERTSIAVLAEQLAAANEVAETVKVIHGDVMDIELPEQVDVIVSEWLGGFGIDEGMLVPVIVARDRWLKAGGVMIPHLVTAWTALVHDSYLAETIEFLREDPFGLRLDVLAEKTVNEIIYSGTFRHLAAGDRRSEPRRLWTTNADRIPLEEAQARLRSARPWSSRPAQSSAPESGPPRLVRSGHGQAGPSRCRAPTGRSTTSNRFGKKSTTERSQEALWRLQSGSAHRRRHPHRG